MDGVPEVGMSSFEFGRSGWIGNTVLETTQNHINAAIILKISASNYYYIAGKTKPRDKRGLRIIQCREIINLATMMILTPAQSL